MEEKNRHILIKAISELPKHTPDESLWTMIELDLSEYYFKKNYITRPKLSPPADLWSKIENKLDEQEQKEINRAHLDKAIHELPKYAPDKNVWSTIATNLKEEKQAKVVSMSKWLKPLSYAACLALLVGAAWFYTISKQNNGSSGKITIAYNEEIVSGSGGMEPLKIDTGSDDEVLKMIETQCSSLPDACANPYFKGLLNQYQELKKVQIETQKVMDENSDEITLKKSMIRIEMEKTKISKKLIQCVSIFQS